MAKGKAKRYTDAEKKEILDFIEAKGRGGQTAAVKKYKVTAATISSWRKKIAVSSPAVSSGAGSKELKAIKELTALLSEIKSTEQKLAGLHARYNKAKAKL